MPGPFTPASYRSTLCRTPSQLAIMSNAAVIGVNQDSLGVQARKLAANGAVSPKQVGAGGGRGSV